MTTMASPRPLVTGGVDTHRDFHVAAALDQVGGMLGTSQFPTTPAGYRSLLGWLSAFGPLAPVGVAGTGSYGSALARHLAAQQLQVITRVPRGVGLGDDRVTHHRGRALVERRQLPELSPVRPLPARTDQHHRRAGPAQHAR
jgi:hypothetical protein